MKLSSNLMDIRGKEDVLVSRCLRKHSGNKTVGEWVLSKWTFGDCTFKELDLIDRTPFHFVHVIKILYLNYIIYISHYNSTIVPQTR